MEVVLSPGAEVDRYVIEGPLGEGGMGAVYRAFDPRLRRRVALKVIRGEKNEITREMTARMMREARAVAALSHPNVVTIYDVGESDGSPFLAMELLAGRTLHVAMQGEDVTIERKLAWLVEIADALAAAHRAGLVHRDVKPENVMVLDNDRVKMLDFGIARAQAPAPRPLDASEPAPSSFRTAAGALAGTPRYMAPEQLAGGHVDARSDEFAWGIVAYEVLSRRHPRDERPEFSHAEGWTAQPKPLDETAPEVPRAIARLIMRALEKEPSRRFRTMDELLDALVEVAPQLAALRARRASSTQPSGESASSADVATTLAPTEGTTKLDGGAMLVAVDAKPSTGGPKRVARVRTSLAMLTLAIVASGAWLATRPRAPASAPADPSAVELDAARRSAALRRCSLDEAGIVDVDKVMPAYGLVATADGALLAGTVTVPNTSAEASYGAAALLPGGNVQRLHKPIEAVSAGFAFPTSGAEPLLVVAVGSSTRREDIVVLRPRALDAGAPSGILASFRTPLTVRWLVARAEGDTVFVAASGFELEKRQPDGEGGVLATGEVERIRAFVYRPNRPIASGLLAERATMLQFTAWAGRGAVLVTDARSTRVLSFDDAANVVGEPVVLTDTTTSAGALAPMGSRVLALWLAPGATSGTHRWAISDVGERASPVRYVPGSEGAMVPSMAATDGGVAAAWVARSHLGNELRVSVVRDPMDLVTASTVVRTASHITRWELAMSGSSAWLAWVESAGRVERLRAAPLRCE